MNTVCLAPSVILPYTSKKALRYVPLCTSSASSYHKLSTSRHHSWSSFPSLSVRLNVLHLHHLLPICATLTPDEEAVAVPDYDDLVEKDWSVLDIDETNTKEERDRKSARIIAAGNISEASKVLVSLGSDDFVDTLMGASSSKSLVVVHESLFSLAGIKERYDDVKCWQGELTDVPESWAPFDAVFLYFLPALPFKLQEVLVTLSTRCSPGARVVISHLQGRQVLQHQRKQYPDVVVSELPDRATLEKTATDNSFVVNEFVDEKEFYLAVLERIA